MSHKIIGSVEVIKRAKAAPSSSKSNLVNWDAIDDMPEEFSAVVTEVSFDPQNLAAAFYDIGSGVFLPRTELLYAIAEARGIKGGGDSKLEAVYEEVDWSRIMSPGGLGVPDLQKVKVGFRVSKWSYVITEDGEDRRSSLCTSTINAWDRCDELWSKEESYTDGYTKQGKYPSKYDTPYKRRSHFANEMKFAAAKAETKAHGKTIRELAGLMTGYKAEDLKDGHFTLHRVQRSEIAIKADAAARRHAMAKGLTGASDQATASLFGPAAVGALPEPEDHIEEAQAPEPPPEFSEGPAEPKAWEILRDTLSEYIGQDYITDEKAKGTVLGIIAWCEEKKDETERSAKWEDAVAWLYYVEGSLVPAGKAIDHGLDRP